MFKNLEKKIKVSKIWEMIASSFLRKSWFYWQELLEKYDNLGSWTTFNG